MLDDGIPLMYRDSSGLVRLAYDPRQITREGAVTLLCLLEPRLLGQIRVRCSPPIRVGGHPCSSPR